MFERYTERARRVIFFARYEASRFGSPLIETEHVLLGLMRETRSSFDLLLPNAAVRATILRQIEERTPRGVPVSTSVDLPLTDACKRVLTFAAEEAEALGHRFIGTEHLFLGLLREDDSFAAQLMRDSGADLERIRKTLAETPPTPTVSSESPKQKLLSLEMEMAGELLAEAQILMTHKTGRPTVEGFEDYTDLAKRAILFAKHESTKNCSETVETEHLLLGLLRQTLGDLYRFLPPSISWEPIRAQVQRQQGVRTYTSAGLQLSMSAECKQALTYATEEARQLSHPAIAVEHLLLGLLRTEGCTASKIMQERGANLEQLRKKLADAAPPDRETSA